MDMPTAARGTSFQKVYQLPAVSYDRRDEHWMRAHRQQLKGDASSVGTASAGVAVAQGTNTVTETPAETTGEAAHGPFECGGSWPAG